MVYKSSTVEQQKKSTATKMATTRIVDKPWVIDGLWQNGVEF